MMTHSRKKIAFLYTRLAPYTLACMKHLKENFDVDLLVFHFKASSEAPFILSCKDSIGEFVARDDFSEQQIKEKLAEYSPQLLYISGWADSGYLRVARYFKGQGVPVVSGLDGQWQGTLRQRLGALVARYYLHPCIDTFWVAGERQVYFANRLGYPDEKLLRGLYCCDWERFSAKYLPPTNHRQKTFLFVGRYVPEKGLDVLLQAYQCYRKRVSAPWELHCIGAGPLEDKLNGFEGVVNKGFVQPEDLPGMLAAASAFVLPSAFEPWGVVVQEAAAVGLPIICSNACGASVHLVQDNHNGFVFDAGNANQLADSMVNISTLPRDSFAAFSQASHELSKQFTPDRWARTIVGGIEGVLRGHA